LQYVHARGPSADADRDARPRVAACGAEPAQDRVAVLRVERRREQPVFAHAGGAQSRGIPIPAGRKMIRGKFITLEGVDGAGKSTHLQFVADALAAASRRHVIVTREPGGTAFAERLRETI